MSREWPASPAQANRPGMIPASLPTDAQAMQGAGAIPALPLEVQHQGDIAYINGGIGDEEEAQLKDTGKSYNLHLLISAVTGEYVSDTHVRVLDSKGNEVLSVDNAGPYLYAKLPPGRYTVEAANATSGTAKKATVSVSDKGIAREHLAFNE
ncbi:MAG: carboxypeptidase regulatory-like domain-containing protein [Pseudomonadota bacterium]|nr:carboxypeptidase regulatory-like domain-containing protein [Pseudomonadota bacterium]